MTQTIAMLVDAYRELNARKMFWIVLFLSLIFVASMASVGINERGLTIFIWELPTAWFNTKVIDRGTFYKTMFISLGFQIWLTWAATILALISTAGIIPDFIGSGAIELTLSKPIGRVRLFLTKYATGLLFVTLQVSIFAVASFFVIGIRGGAWLPGLFLSVPLVVVFFSYLYCMATLIGLLTRSTVASLLMTILLWGLIFMLHLSETGIVLQMKVQQDIKVELLEADIQSRESEVDRLRNEQADRPRDDEPDARDERRLQRLESTLARRRKSLEESRHSQRLLTRAHRILFAAKTILPKTSETMDLLQRQLISSTELEGLQDAAAQGQNLDLGSDPDDVRVPQRRVMKEVTDIVNGRSVAWVMGTSLAFELVILTLACGIFVRRDF